MNQWNRFWSKHNFNSIFLKAHYNITFHIYKEFLDFIKIKDPEILELGCGTGELTIRIIERYGGKATLIDNSTEAIKISTNNLKKHNIKSSILKKDLFKFKPKKKFDLVHSDGLIEHFVDDKQKEVIRVHKRLVKNKGFIIFCVPRPTWYYKLFRWLVERKNKWPFGYEKPLNKKELRALLKSCGLNVVKTSEYFYHSFALAKI